MPSPFGRIAASLALSVASLLLFAPTARSSPELTSAATKTERMHITVTTASDAANGDTSSPASLTSGPGPDGISLREAILVTNNDPGRYRVGFADRLAGGSIQVG